MRAANEIFALFLDRFRQPLAAHVDVRAVVENRILFDRHLLGKVVTFLGPTLKLLPSAFAFAEECFPRMRRALMVLPVRFKKSLDEFIRGELMVELEHRGDSFSGGDSYVRAEPAAHPT